MHFVPRRSHPPTGRDSCGKEGVVVIEMIWLGRLQQTIRRIMVRRRSWKCFQNRLNFGSLFHLHTLINLTDWYCNGETFCHFVKYSLEKAPPLLYRSEHKIITPLHWAYWRPDREHTNGAVYIPICSVLFFLQMTLRQRNWLRNVILRILTGIVQLRAR